VVNNTLFQVESSTEATCLNTELANRRNRYERPELRYERLVQKISNQTCSNTCQSTFSTMAERPHQPKQGERVIIIGGSYQGRLGTFVKIVGLGTRARVVLDNDDNVE
jgi:hypothetical protein